MEDKTRFQVPTLFHHPPHLLIHDNCDITVAVKKLLKFHQCFKLEFYISLIIIIIEYISLLTISANIRIHNVGKAHNHSLQAFP